MKALDIVRTPKGAIGFITETNNHGQTASINFIGDTNKEGENNAWWSIEQLEVIDSIPKMIATAMCHPFGKGREDVISNFKI
jgi:hypothetical protein